MSPNAPMFDAQASGVVGRFLESSASVFGTIGQRVRSLLKPVHQNEAEQIPVSEEDRALQTTRIQLRLFCRTGAMDQIAKIALSSQKDEIIALSIKLLRSGEDGSIDQLSTLARSGSKTALPAIAALLDEDRFDVAEGIFAHYLENGELFSLIKERRADPLVALEIIARLEYPDSEAIQLFEQISDCLNEHPVERIKLFGKILGDRDPSSPKEPRVLNHIHPAIKLLAVERIQQCHPIDEERFLWFATRDKDELVAYEATTRLLNRWQSNAGRVPFGIEPFPMLDINLLLHLCHLGASLQWRESPDIEALLKRNSKAYKTLKQLDKKENKVEYDALAKEVNDSAYELERISERRVNLLQPLLNKVSDTLNLPYARLGTTDDRSVAAMYLIGTGEVRMYHGVLFEDKPVSEEVMSSLLHEMGHMEQDVLIIRLISDELGIRFGEHRHLLRPLWDKYSHCIGYAPDHMFLLGVLRVRGDRPLTDVQRKRAQRLLDSSYRMNEVHDRERSIRKQLNEVARSFNALLNGEHDAHLLQCFRDQSTLEMLFRQGRVPSVLVEEVNNCRVMIEQVISSLSGVTNGGTCDAFAFAQQLYNSKGNQEIVKLVKRLKDLVLIVLDEEYEDLSRAFRNAQKTGYHEDEAYIISDRVEVIVKALRQEWYQIEY